MAVACYKFDEFELDSSRFELRRNGRSLKLERIPMELLLLLAEKEGDVVSRQEISNRLWGKDVFVDAEHGINTAIRKIRTVLRDDAEHPRFVQTVQGKGYRFIAEARNGNSRGSEAPPEVPMAMAMALPLPPAEPAPAKLPHWRHAGIATLSFFLLAGALLVLNPGGLRNRIFGTPKGPIRSIAVLPISNLSGDPAQDYFADGLTDELITALAKNRSLRLVSRTSAMQYKGVNRPVREIARELGVDGIVEGSVVRSPHSVHMTLQLIQASSDSHVWAESYDRELGSSVTLPGEMAQAIFAQLNVTPVSRLRALQVSPEAHDAFLQGRYYWFSNRNLESAQYFRKAIDLQPDYAAAWSGLAISYTAAAVQGQLRGEDAWPQAEAATTRALGLDDLLPDAHLALAANLLFHHWDFARADQESARTIQIDPNFAEAHHLRSYVLHALNRTDEALSEQRKATELDPFARPWALGSELWRLRRFDAAAEDARLRLKARPNDFSAHFLLSDVYRWKGMKKEAAEELEQGFREVGNQGEADAVKQAYKRGGLEAVLEMNLSDLKRKVATEYVPKISLAYAYAELGIQEEAIRNLQLAYDEHSPRMIHLQYEPDFDFLHSDPRYRDIVRKVGLPPAF